MEPAWGAVMPWGPEVRSPSTEDTQAQPITSHLTFSEQGLDPIDCASPLLNSLFQAEFTLSTALMTPFP